MIKLLIIDDESGIVEEVKSFFEEEGYQVDSADTAKAGREKIDIIRPDVLILDIKLPDASGLDVLKYCKQKSPLTKVIVNTGYVDQSIIDDAEDLGRDAFLQKPFNLEVLLNEVDRVLGKKDS